MLKYKALKTTTRFVGIWMVFFFTKCLICFYDRKMRSTPSRDAELISFAIWNLKKMNIAFSLKWGKFIVGRNNVYRCFSLRSRVFHWTPPPPPFSTRPRVFQTPCFPHSGTPYLRSPAPRFHPPIQFRLLDLSINVFMSICLKNRTFWSNKKFSKTGKNSWWNKAKVVALPSYQFLLKV